jgi:hypothetical protein
VGEVVLTCDKLRPHNSSKMRWRAWTMMMKRKRKRMVRCRSLDQDVGQRQICSVCWRCPTGIYILETTKKENGIIEVVRIALSAGERCIA